MSKNQRLIIQHLVSGIQDLTSKFYNPSWYLKTIAANAPPAIGPTRYNQMFAKLPLPIVASIRIGPMPTAGLKAPPEIPPPAKAAAATVKPMARP